MRYTIEEIYSKKNKKEKQRKVMRIIVYILIIPILIYNMVILFQAFSNSDEMPNFLGYKSFVIVSGSMLPELEIGDIVVVKSINEVNLKEGDIISFREGNSIITHRIDHVIDNGKRFITKGDANSSEDINPVDLENIEGIYEFKIPKFGKFVLFMQNKTGIIIIALIIYILYIVNKSKEEKIIMRKEKREIYEKINEEKNEKE